MRRIFTKDVGANYSKGEDRDYPKATWDGIEQSAGESLGSFSKPFGEAALAGISGANASKSKPRRTRK